MYLSPQIKHRLVALSLALVLFPQSTNAGLFDKIKGAVKEGCDPKNFGDIANIAKQATDRVADGAAAAGQAVKKVGQGALKTATDLAALQKGLDEALSAAGEIQRQINEIACTGTKCSGLFIWEFTKGIPGAIIRWKNFDGSLDDIREQVFVRLAGILKEVRESREDPERLSRAMAKLLLFTTETPFKIQSAAVEQVSVSLSPMAAMPGILMPSVSTSGGDLGKGIGDVVVGRLIKNLHDAITSPGLTFQQRVDQIMDADTIFDGVLVDTAEKVGWKDLQNEIQMWKAAEAKADAVAIPPADLK